MINNSENINNEEIGSKYPFQSPDGYFDALPAVIMSRVETKTKQPKLFVPLRYLRPAIGLFAASVLLIGFIFVTPVFFPSEKISATQDDDVVEYYLTSQLSALNIFESMGKPSEDEVVSGEQLEEVLIATVSEYELIDFNSVK